MNTEKIDLKKVRINENNPRTMSEAKAEKLMFSLLSFPKMMQIRPIVLDEQMIALGGNMRATALKSIAKMSDEELKQKLELSPDYNSKNEAEQQAICEFWVEWKKKPFAYVINAENLTEDEKRQFIIKDNVGFGAWDWDKLANEWESEKLLDWGLDVWNANDNVDILDDLKESGFNDEVHESIGKFSMSFTFPIEHKEMIEGYIKLNGKDAIQDEIIDFVRSRCG